LLYLVFSTFSEFIRLFYKSGQMSYLFKQTSSEQKIREYGLKFVWCWVLKTLSYYWVTHIQMTELCLNLVLKSMSNNFFYNSSWVFFLQDVLYSSESFSDKIIYYHPVYPVTPRECLHPWRLHGQTKFRTPELAGIQPLRLAKDSIYFTIMGIYWSS